MNGGSNKDFPAWIIKLMYRILQFTRTGYQYHIVLNKVGAGEAQISISEIGKIETLK